MASEQSHHLVKNPGETGQTRCQGEAEGGGPHEGGECYQIRNNDSFENSGE